MIVSKVDRLQILACLGNPDPGGVKGDATGRKKTFEYTEEA